MGKGKESEKSSSGRGWAVVSLHTWISDSWPESKEPFQVTITKEAPLGKFKHGYVLFNKAIHYFKSANFYMWNFSLSIGKCFSYETKRRGVTKGRYLCVEWMGLERKQKQKHFYPFEIKNSKKFTGNRNMLQTYNLAIPNSYLEWDVVNIDQLEDSHFWKIIKWVKLGAKDTYSLVYNFKLLINYIEKLIKTDYQEGTLKAIITMANT